MRSFVQASLVWQFCLALAFSQNLRELEVEIPQGKFVGLPIHWSASNGVLMQPSGGFVEFDMSELREHSILERTYQPETVATARARLQGELGPEFDTATTSHYVIAAPKGELARWHARFAALHSGFHRYFTVRGWELRKPDFPLTVIVLRSQEEFRNFAAYENRFVLGGVQLPQNAVGVYFPRTNRCILFNIPQSGGTDWSETEATIVHEAVHQLAYNTGLHERLFENPLWYVEGLATMFEVPKVYDTQVASSNIVDRMHVEKLLIFRQLAEDPSAVYARIQSLILSDDLYRSDPTAAYSLGWAMVFYLSERMPREFRQFVALQQARRFGEYTPADRIEDFRRAFGSEEFMYSQMLRLYK